MKSIVPLTISIIILDAKPLLRVELRFASHGLEEARLSADVAQLAEQSICNRQVTGSSPVVGFVSMLSIEYNWLACLRVDVPSCKGDGL